MCHWYIPPVVDIGASHVCGQPKGRTAPTSDPSIHVVAAGDRARCNIRLVAAGPVYHTANARSDRRDATH